MNRLPAVLKSFFVRFISKSAKCQNCHKSDLKANMEGVGLGQYVCSVEDCMDEFDNSEAW